MNLWQEAVRRRAECGELLFVAVSYVFEIWIK